MQVRTLQNYDMPSVKKWLDYRGLEYSPEKTELGFIIPGVCSAQFTKCENNLFILDSLVSNPYVSPKTRNKAIDTLVTEMLQVADKMGIKRIIAFTEDLNTFHRAEKHGFVHSFQQLLVYRGN